MKDTDSIYTAAVVGLGRIGLGYDLNSKPSEIFSHTKAYLNHPSFRLIGGVDIEPEKRKEFETYSQTHAFETVEGLFESRGNLIDCISICTPTPVHRETIKGVLGRPLRIILLEKPLSNCFDDAQQILDVVEKPVQLAVNYIRRWDPAILEIKNVIEKKILEEPTVITCIYSNGLFNGASHSIDLIHFWFGEEKEVVYLGSRHLGNGDLSVDFILKFNSFDVYFHSIILDKVKPSILEMDMIFQNGRIKILNNGWDVQLFRHLSEENSQGKGVLYGEPTYLINDMNRYQYNVIDGLYRNLKHGEPIISNGQSAMATMKTCNEIQRKKETYER